MKAPDPLPVEVQTAADDLVAALFEVAAINGVREGYVRTIAYTQYLADPADPSHFEALDALPVFSAVLGLVEAVTDARGGK